MKKLDALLRLERKHHELLGLAQVMVGLLESNQVEALDDAWAKRGRLFREISQLHRELSPSFQDWHGFLSQLRAAEQPRARQAVESLERKARQVLELDARSRVMLAQHVEELSSQIKRLSEGRQLLRSYRAANQRMLPPLQVSRTG